MPKRRTSKQDHPVVPCRGTRESLGGHGPIACNRVTRHSSGLCYDCRKGQPKEVAR